ncbi:MAG: glycosyltransferase family 4 protein [bacterium]
MKIMILTCEGFLTGATRSTSLLAKGLAEKGHRVIVGCPEGALLGEILKDSAAEVLPIAFRSKLDFNSITAIRDIVRREKIQIINAQSSTDRYLSIFAKKLYRLPVHVVHTRRQRSLSMGGAVQRKFYVRGTSKIVVVSDQLKAHFVENGYPAEHIQVIYNGLSRDFFAHADPARTEQLRGKFGIQPHDRVVGCISRLKNQEQLVRSAKFLPEDVKIFFAGIEKGHFDSLAREIPIKNQIIYAGVVPIDDVVNYYGLLDVFVLPSTMDGFGLVLVEAMGMGVPVVATRSFGIIDVLDNERNGLMFDDGDIEGLAERIQRIVSDDELRGRLVENGRKAALERFTIEKTVENYEGFFENLLI